MRHLTIFTSLTLAFMYSNCFASANTFEDDFNNNTDSSVACSSSSYDEEDIGLPAELMCVIAEFVEKEDSLNFSLTSKAFRDVLFDPKVMQKRGIKLYAYDIDTFKEIFANYYSEKKCAVPLTLQGKWVTNDILKELKNATHLTLLKCPNINNEGIEHLKDQGELRVILCHNVKRKPSESNALRHSYAIANILDLELTQLLR